jgi:hypothetical protein
MSGPKGKDSGCPCAPPCPHMPPAFPVCEFLSAEGLETLWKRMDDMICNGSVQKFEITDWSLNKKNTSKSSNEGFEDRSIFCTSS